MKKPFAGGPITPKPQRLIDTTPGEYVLRGARATMLRYDMAEAVATGKINPNAEPITITVTIPKPPASK